MRLIDADELRKEFKKYPFFTDVHLHYAREIIDNSPTVELTASFMRQHAEDELIRIRAEADQRGYQRGYNWGLETGKNLKRPTGEWIPVMHRNSFGMLIDCFQCSNCNLYTLPQIKVMICEELKICPNCGAKMKSEGEE